MILPRENLADLEDLSEEERKRITVYPASNLDDVLDAALRRSERYASQTQGEGAGESGGGGGGGPIPDLVTTLS